MKYRFLEFFLSDCGFLPNLLSLSPSSRVTFPLVVLEEEFLSHTLHQVAERTQAMWDSAFQRACSFAVLRPTLPQSERRKTGQHLVRLVLGGTLPKSGPLRLLLFKS